MPTQNYAPSFTAPRISRPGLRRPEPGAQDHGGPSIQLISARARGLHTAPERAVKREPGRIELLHPLVQKRGGADAARRGRDTIPTKPGI